MHLQQNRLRDNIILNLKQDVQLVNDNESAISELDSQEMPAFDDHKRTIENEELDF